MLSDLYDFFMPVCLRKKFVRLLEQVEDIVEDKLA